MGSGLRGRVCRAAGAALVGFLLVQEPAAGRVSFLTHGLVGYWKLDETADPSTGSFPADSSGNGNHGQYVVRQSTLQPDTATKAPLTFANVASLQFAQADPATTSFSRVIVPDSPTMSVTGSFSIAAWIRPVDGIEQHGILEKWDTDSVGNLINGFFLRLNSSEQVSWNIFGPAGSTGSGVSPSPVALGAWTHVALVHDASLGQGILYVGGSAPSGAVAVSAPPGDGSQDARLGSDYGQNVFNGHLDDVRLYNRALTPTEVASLAAGDDLDGASPPPPPPPPPPSAPDTRDAANGNDSLNDRCGCTVGPGPGWGWALSLAGLLLLSARRR